LKDKDALLLSRIAEGIRAYRGISRKSGIRFLSSLISENAGNVIAAKGEDGAVISIDGKKLVFAADGIIEEMVDEDPEWAGYCSVLVNVNDILAMRGRPIAAVDIISATDGRILSKIVSGMEEACSKFGVDMVGGHLHPDSTHNDISVAMIGEVARGGPLLSTTAKPGEAVVAICDCSGRFTPGLPYSWDSTSMKSRREIMELTDTVLSALRHLSSGKDISNPGLLGTLAMLLESSGVGATVDIGKIPIPKGVDLLQWLKAYQGFGFVGTVPDSKLDRMRAELEGSGLSSAVMGRVRRSRQFKIRTGSSERVLFDLSSEKITGLF